MRQKVKLLSAVLILLFASCSSTLLASAKTEINIIPQPVTLKTSEGCFTLDADVVIVLAPEDSELGLVADKLLNKINAAASFQIITGHHVPFSKKSILFKLDETLTDLGPEGYRLSVLPQRIEIIAPKPAGAFYGVQSLLQLLPVEFADAALKRDKWHIPCVEITDYPRFQWRGQLLDVSRHFHPVNHIKRNLDNLARLKMNRFHWHLTDDQGWRIEIKSLPKLTEIGAWRVDRNDKSWWEREFPKPGEKATYGGFYTQEEIKDIIRYAQERYIVIIPEIDMPGHSRAFMAAYPQVSCDGGPYQVASGGDERNKDLCPGKEITFDLVEKVIDEVTSLFPGSYYHIGGDECRKPAWKKCPDCQKRIQAEGLKNFDELQSYFIKRVEKMINKRGKIMIGWDEILEGGLAPNATVMSWRGEVGGIKAVEMGHDVIMTPNTHCYLDLKQGDSGIEPDLGYGQLLLPTVYSYNPLPSNIAPEQAKHILGVQGNLWSESIQNENDANYMLFPRLLAIAEVGWSPQDAREWKKFVPRMESAFRRFDILGVNYARSAYNVWFKPSGEKTSSKISITLETEAGSAGIRYTLDGSEPSLSSQLYTGPIGLNRTTTISARSFLNDKPFGKIATQTLQFHKAAGKKVRLSAKPDSEYDPGESGLSDCLRGRANMLHQNWSGFAGEGFEAVVDLEAIIAVKTITASILEATDDGVFLPAKIELGGSSDGINFSTLGIITPEQTSVPKRSVKEFSVNTEVRARYIKMVVDNIGVIPDWHPAAGSNAWLFIDELIVQ